MRAAVWGQHQTEEEKLWRGGFGQEVSGACGRAPKSSPGAPEGAGYFSYSGDVLGSESLLEEEAAWLGMTL